MNDKIIISTDNLSEAEIEELLKLHDTSYKVEERPAYRLLQDAAYKYPDRTALIAADRTLTYRELNGEANALGHVLRNMGSGPETIIAVMADRDSYAYVMREGALKSGGAFMPVDPTYPDDRISYIMDDSEAALLVTTKKVMNRRPGLFESLAGKGIGIICAEEAVAKGPGDDLNVEVPPEALAYVIYTSGSTGRPKGVMLTNSNLVNFADDNEKNGEALAFVDKADVSISIAAFTFDVSVTEEFVPYSRGMTNVLATMEQFMDPVTMRDLIINNHVGAMTCTPTYLLNMIEIEAFKPAVKCLKSIDLGAEAFPGVLYERLMEINPDLYVVNTYGPTEATVSCTLKEVTSADDITIGRPLANVKMAVIDADGKLQPIGAVGELVIMGAGVGRGYINQDELTKKSFVTLFGMPAYRSGDLARIREDGDIEFHGRMDDQVKLRGLRVELGEIEAVMSSYPGVRSCTVKVIKGKTDYLAAYFTADTKIDIPSLKEYLSGALTAYMVPQAYMQLEEMPLTTNGKVDKKALPEIEPEEEEIVPAENELQEKILKIASEALGGARIGITTDLIGAGLSSLGCMRLCSMLRESMGSSIKIADIYGNSTVKDIEKLIGIQGKETIHELRDEYPLSMTQTGIYIECERYPDTTIYNIPGLYKLDEDVDLDRLTDSVSRAVEAHPYLLMQPVRGDKGEMLARRRDSIPFEVKRIKCGTLPAEDILVHPFDMDSGEILFRAEIYSTDEGRYFFIDTHHIVSDGGSLDILIRDIERAYQGEELMKESYTGYEFALDEEAARKSPRLEKAKAWHDSLFSGCGGETMPVKDGDVKEGHIAYYRIHGETDGSSIRSYCEEHSLTHNAFFTSAFALALCAYTASEQAVFTAIYNGRNDVRLKDSVSMLVKTLPVLLPYEAETGITDYIEECQSYLLAAMANDIYSFSEIRNAYDIKADIMLAFQGEYIHGAIIGGKYAELTEPGLSRARAALGVDISLDGDRVFFESEYDPSVFSEYTVSGFVKLIDHIAGEMTGKQKLKDISLITETDEKSIIELYDTYHEVKKRPAYRLLQDAADRYAARMALIAVDRKLTYRELNEEANALGHVLREKGSGPEVKVAVLADRDSYAYVMREGALKSGGAFMPIDPGYPDDRISFIIEDSKAFLLVTTPKIIERRSGLLDSLGAKGVSIINVEEAVAKGSKDNLNVEVSPENLAYVIYTSGSTGRPKGVMLTNSNLVNFADDNEKNGEALAFVDKADVSISIAAFTFDVSVTEEFVPYSRGMTNVLATMEQFMDPVTMRDLIINNNVGAMTCTPTYLLNMIEIEAFRPAIKCLKSIDLGAEAFPGVLYERLMEINPDLYVVNTYGPTEATVSCTLKEVTSADDITIGRPLANVKMATLDRSGRLQPPGAMGELVIMGAGVGRGYIGRDDLTEKSFISLLGLPAYRSGDLARIRRDGDIEFHGRMDDQVKLRGLRVELGEVEAVMSSYPGVRSSSVIVVRGKTDYLAAYFTADEEIDIVSLREHLSARLTSYMVPQAYMQLEEMPLTPNGKVNRKALPEPRFYEEEIIPAGNEMQEGILADVSKVLPGVAAGISTDLFGAGMSSIGCIRFCSLLSERFGVNVRVAEIFDNKTVKEIEKLIREKLDGSEDGETDTDYEIRELYPLSMTQTGIYIECEKHPGTTIYNIPELYRLDPSTDTDRLAQAVEKAVHAHPYLFMTVVRNEKGEVFAKRRDDCDFKVRRVSCATLPSYNELTRPYDLDSDEVLCRAEIYETGDGSFFYLDTHHIVSDGESEAILLEDINRAYSGEEIGKEEYTGYEYALDEEAARKGERLEKAGAFYHSIFAGCGGETLPVRDRKGKADGTDNSPHIAFECLTGEVDADAIRRFCKKNSLTLNSFLTTAFAITLKSYTASEQAVFTTVYNGRNDTRLKNSVSMLVKTLPVYLACEAQDPVVSAIEGCQKYLLSAMANDIYSFAEIRNAYEIKGDILFVYQDEYEDDVIIGTEKAQIIEMDLDQTKALINIETFTKGDRIMYRAEYDPAVYTQYTVGRLIRLTDKAAAEMLVRDKLGDIELTTQADIEEIRDLYDTSFEVVKRPAYRLLQDSAAKFGNRKAFVAVDRTLTYKELNEEANAIGNILKGMGVGPETIVAVMADRNSYAYVMRQGVLKSGGAFLPIDPVYPEDRIRFMIEDSGTGILMTTADIIERRKDLFEDNALKGIKIIEAEKAAGEGDRSDLNVEVPFDALAYIIYTSGSTGRPKGAMITNRNLINYVEGNKKYHSVWGPGTKCSKSLAVAPLTFDFSIEEEFIPVSCGMTIVLASHEQIMNPIMLASVMRENNVDIISGTPSYWLNFVDMAESSDVLRDACSRLTAAVIGGEAFVPALYTKLTAVNPELYIMNVYGPTETTVVCAIDVIKSENDITIGLPCGNVHLATLDRDGRLQPRGAVGELVIMSEGVARGYLGRDELTKKSFITLLGRRAYRSGDLVRIREDGKIEYHGRIDDQVKLRGLRIELGEVESVINSYPGIRSSKVIVVKQDSEFLAAYFTSDEKTDTALLKKHLETRLTEYMIPQVFMQLDEMPLTANGKIDKRALPTVQMEAEEITAPENAEQEQMLAVACEVLKTKRIGVDSDLFAMGLTSITSIALCIRMSGIIGKDVTVSDIFVSRNIRNLDALLREKTVGESHALQEDYPLSRTQLGIFTESLRLAGETSYNIPCLYRLDPEVDIKRLRDALKKVVIAHPYLTMTIKAEDGSEPRAKRNPPEDFDIPVFNGSPMSEDIVRPFDLLSGEPLSRISLYDAPDGKYLFFDIHHILFDGESLKIFLEDINDAYAGKPVETEKYTGYEAALDEESLRATDRLKAAKAWYDSTCKGCEACTLPLAETNVPADNNTGSSVIRGTAHADAIRDYCENNKLTPNAFFTTAFALALNAYTGSETAVFAVIHNGRTDPRTERSISMFVKTLPVVMNVNPDNTVLDTIYDCRTWLTNASGNDLFSFAEISREYGIRSDVLFAYQGEKSDEDLIGGLPAEFIELSNSQTKSDFGLDVFLDGHDVVYETEYDPMLYSGYTMEGFVRMMDHICEQMITCERIRDIRLVRPEDEQAILELYDTGHEVKERPAYRLLQDAADRYGDRTALIAVDRELTYRELNGEANALGHVLRDMGSGPEVKVAVLADRDSYAYVMREGVLKSGGAFMPMAPDYPDDRISFILEDSKASLLVTTPGIIGRRTGLFDSLAAKGINIVNVEEAVAGGSRDNLNVEVPPEALAYVIYTSGSTGRPKGVMLTNSNLVNFADDNEKNGEALAFVDKADVSISIAAFTFDVSVTEEFVPYSRGMTNVLATMDQFMDPIKMRDLMVNNNVGAMTCTPTYMLNMIEIEAFRPAIKCLKSIDLGAEAFPGVLYDRLMEINPDLYVVNTYGPTEATVSCTLKEVTSADDINIGRPLANVKMATFDRTGRLQPPGAMGELVIMGAGVGRGYIGRDDLTEKNFIRLLGLPAYRSGDLARICRDGDIEFHGRMDDQVKLRGLRVELGEVEAVMSSYPGVRSSAVIVAGGKTDYLAAYFTADEEIDTVQLKTHLSARLASYMVPQVFMQLKEMPLTPHGKVNKKALPEPRLGETASRNIVPPAGELQQQLCAIFAKALQLEEVGITENFFSDLGGTSLRASSVLISAMNRNIPLVYQDIFDAPTVESLAKLILERQGKAGDEISAEPKNTVKAEPIGCLSHNTNEHLGELESEPLGNVLLTGATGFLGIHVLRELIENTDEKVYCLVHSGKVKAEHRLKDMLYYYFETAYEDLFGERLFVVEGDITHPETFDSLSGTEYRTVINCAACVKHFADIEYLKSINYKGVENLTELCLKTNTRLIHISTVSVAGSVEEENKDKMVLTEDMLDIGQEVEDNGYVYTKYLAEKHVLKCIEEKNLDAKIIRVGNLSSRVRDGEFQVNFRTNAFMNSLKAYAVLGCFPMSLMSEKEDLSYVDETARAIIALSGTGSSFTVFHAYNSHAVEMGDLVNSMNELGISVRPVTDAEFERRLQEGLLNDKISHYLSPLIEYDLSGDNKYTEVCVDNSFTTNVLYALGFGWTITDRRIIRRMLEVMLSLGFFDL